MPVWPVNQRMPSPSNTAVLRFEPRRSLGSGKIVTSSVSASTRTIAFEAAVGDPGVAIRPGDDAVGRGPGTERDRPDRSRRGVEVAERAVVLAGVPDAAVWRRSDVMRMRAGHDVELPDDEIDGGFPGWRRGRRWSGRRGARWGRGRWRDGGRAARRRGRRRSAPARDEQRAQAQQAEAAQDARVARHGPMMPREPKSVERGRPGLPGTCRLGCASGIASRLSRCRVGGRVWRRRG